MQEAADYAWRRFRKTMIVGAIVFLAWIFLVRPLAPVIEERWFPVIDSAVVVDTMPGDGGSLLFRYRFEKHRDCDLIEARWYYLDKGVIGPADITRSGQTPSRPVGPNISFWWRLGPGELVPGTYFITLRYDCGWPWTSRSTLGPFQLARSP